MTAPTLVRILLKQESNIWQLCIGLLVPVVVEIKHSEQYFFKFFDEMLKKICIDYREEKELFDKEEKEKSAIRRNSHVIISRTNSVEKFL